MYFLGPGHTPGGSESRSQVADPEDAAALERLSWWAARAEQQVRKTPSWLRSWANFSLL